MINYNGKGYLQENVYIYWRRKWQPTPIFLPGESQGQRSLVGCCLWGRRVRHDWSDLAAAAAALRSQIHSFGKHCDFWPLFWFWPRHGWVFKLLLFIYFWLCWVFIVAYILSLVVANGGYCLLWCTGFSLQWLLLLQSMGPQIFKN